MNKKAINIICCFFILMTIFCRVSGREMPLCLVLGFESEQLSDLEDRLLRENLMRELKAAGFRVVNVMEVENLIQEGGIDIRKVKPAVMKTILSDLKPDIVIKGMLYPVSGSVKEKKLVSGRVYCFGAMLWFRGKDMYFRNKKKTAFNGSLLTFFSGISGSLAENIKDTYKNLSRKESSK